MEFNVDDHRESDNRLDLLLFLLGGRQRFAINVLKVKEVVPCPDFTHMPRSHPAVVGVTQLRGEALTVVDISSAIGRAPLYGGTGSSCKGAVIVTEFNRRIQGFLVQRVDRIVMCDWKQVVPPPVGSSRGSYITGVTRIDEELIEILDVERILGEVIHPDEFQLPPTLQPGSGTSVAGRLVLLVDDSSMARHQTAQTLDQLGVVYLVARDGKEAIDLLRENRQSEEPDVEMVISDIEMPEMDGYSLTRAIRADPDLNKLYVLLHTSLNGAINAERARQSGADDILTKFVPDELSLAVVRGLTGGAPTNL
jgi:two-component system chemotaxis response regulator CheV